MSLGILFGQNLALGHLCVMQCERCLPSACSMPSSSKAHARAMPTRACACACARVPACAWRALRPKLSRPRLAHSRSRPRLDGQAWAEATWAHLMGKRTHLQGDEQPEHMHFQLRPEIHTRACEKFPERHQAQVRAIDFRQYSYSY